MVRASLVLGAVIFGAASVLAHPGHDASIEARERAEYFASVPVQKRSLAHCADKIKARGDHARAIARRHAHAQQLKKKREFLKSRDIAAVLATNHKSNLTGITLDTDPSVLFGDNATCLLTPETTEGPYYVSGEYVREDISEKQAGVTLTVDVEIIDVNTCEPLPEVLLEFWHCNATGVYSGVIANGNGNSNDATNVNNTWLRGIQKSDSNGVLTFTTIFPGHYAGRATHIHVLAHLNSTVLPNNTITGGTVSHVGQIFFDQDLINEVETVTPYSTNKQSLTTNAEDMILSQEAADVDPVVEYVLLGDTVADGIFSWISFGMDSAATRSISAAATYGENGGVMNSNGGNGGGPPGGGPPGGGNGTALPPSPSATSSDSSSSSASATGAAPTGSNIGQRDYGVTAAVLFPAAVGAGLWGLGFF